MKVTAIFLFLFFSLTAFAQSDSYEMSAAIDLPQSGWNKLIQMHNGNTLLFHFENKNDILVKVFDKAHKEIASEKAGSQLVNMNKLDQGYFDGLHEINGEAVLFMTQQVDRKDALMRLSFDAKTGKLLNEENVSQAQNFPANSACFVLKEPAEDRYYIICFSKGSIADAGIIVRMYNEHHEMVRQAPLGMVKSGYDNIHLVSEEIDRHGSIMITVELDKIVRYPDIIEKYVVLYYLAKDAPEFTAKVVHLPRGTKDLNINFTDNEFANTLNIFMSSLFEHDVPETANVDYVTSLIHMMLIADRELIDVNQVQLNDEKIREYVQSHIGKPAQFAGNTLNAYTNTTGITTVINEDIQPYTEKDPASATGYVGVTQYNAEGKEKWGTLLTKAKHTKAALSLDGSEVFKVRTSEYELSQTLCLSTNNNSYVIFNEMSDNYDKGLGSTFTAIADFHQTNAMYYRVNKKREITKSYLFGPATNGEFKYAYTYSGGFNEHKNIFATLMQYRKGANVSTHIAWCHLDN